MGLIEKIGIVGVVLAVSGLMRRFSRSTPKERVTVEVSRFWYAAARNPIISFVIGTLTGVAITFSPIFLFLLGREGADVLDWRVVACVATTYFVGVTYTALGAPVMRHAGDSRRGRAPMLWPAMLAKRRRYEPREKGGGHVRRALPNSRPQPDRTSTRTSEPTTTYGGRRPTPA